MAILYSRTGETEMAVESYLKACRQDHAYVHRGNLDPEISTLIKTYGLNQEEEEPPSDHNSGSDEREEHEEDFTVSVIDEEVLKWQELKAD